MISSLHIHPKKTVLIPLWKCDAEEIQRILKLSQVEEARAEEDEEKPTDSDRGADEEEKPEQDGGGTAETRRATEAATGKAGEKPNHEEQAVAPLMETQVTLLQSERDSQSFLYWHRSPA